MPLYYVVLNANDSIKFQASIPAGYSGNRFVLTVEAKNDDEARALILNSFEQPSDKKDFE